MSFGERLRKVRKEQNMTRNRLAEICGVTPQSMCRYENKGCIPTLRVAIDLAGALGVSLDYLVQDEIAERRRETNRETPSAVSRETEADEESETGGD